VLAGLAGAEAARAFAAMTEHDLDRVVRASQLRYFAPGEVVLAPAAERPASCFVVRQGTVRGERPGVTGDAAALWELSAGEMFPLGALLARRGVTSVYRATQDTFCLAVPVAVFDGLIASSPVFQDFCTRRLAHLLDLSRAHLQAEYAASATEQRGLATRWRALRQAPIAAARRALGRRSLMEERPIGRCRSSTRQRPLGSSPARTSSAAWCWSAGRWPPRWAR
jgi:CBS domain-containing protein